MKLIIILILASCSPNKFNRDIEMHYVYGDTVCREAYYRPCGLSLYNCSDGNEYKCVTNVKEEKIYK